VALLGDADRHSFIFVGIEAANDRSRGCKRNLMLAGAAAEEDADAETFVGSHVRILWS
jgi:hypothetical protein